MSLSSLISGEIVVSVEEWSEELEKDIKRHVGKGITIHPEGDVVRIDVESVNWCSHIKPEHIEELYKKHLGTWLEFSLSYYLLDEPYISIEKGRGV